MLQPFNKPLWHLFQIVAILAVTGCQSLVAAPDSSAPSQQLIIKFKPNSVACNADGIAQLSLAAHITLEYIRPMSGDACVVKHSANTTSRLDQEQKALKQHPAVEWLEQDVRVRAL